MANEETHRCRSCGTPLAADNAGEHCGSCQAAERRRAGSPPAVPLVFWQDPDMQAALRSRHMGKVIRAYRHHRHHRHDISQEQLAKWAYTSQAHISRLENRRNPVHDLNQLLFWAQFLHIPQRHLWFELPESAHDAAGRPDTATGLSQTVAATGDATTDAGSDAGEPPDNERGTGRDELSGVLAGVMTELKDLKSSVERLSQSRPSSGDEQPEPTSSAERGVGEAPPADSRGDVSRPPTSTHRVRGRRPGDHDVARAPGTARPAEVSADLKAERRESQTLRGSGPADLLKGDVTELPTLPRPPIDITLDTAQTARMADYLLGGQANFTIDRDVIEYITGALPGGIDTARATVRHGQEFLCRAIEYVVKEPAVRQVVNVGPTIPSGVRIHEVAQAAAPNSNVVYVINDDVALAHAHQLTTVADDGSTAFIRGSLDNPATLVSQLSLVLDLDRPVAVIIQSGGLSRISDDDAASHVVTRLVKAMASGSFLILTHLALDLIGSAITAAIQRHQEVRDEGKMPSLTLRDRAQVTKFFDLLELVGPGVVPVDQWYSDRTERERSNNSLTFTYGGVGRKP